MNSAPRCTALAVGFGALWVEFDDLVRYEVARQRVTALVTDLRFRRRLRLWTQLDPDPTVGDYVRAGATVWQAHWGPAPVALVLTDTAAIKLLGGCAAAVRFFGDERPVVEGLICMLDTLPAGVRQLLAGQVGRGLEWEELYLRWALRVALTGLAV